MKRKWLAVGIIFLFIGMSIIPSTAQDTKNPLPTSDGKWWYVGGSGPGNYTSIQDAINDSDHGDTVFVFHGTYYEHIIIDKGIYLIGENVNTTIIIDNFSHEVCAIAIQQSNVHVKGFTIKGEATAYVLGLGGSNIIEGNNIIGSDGITVGSYSNLILNNTITAYGLPGAGLGCGIDEIRSYNRIENNSIYSPINTGISVWGDSNVIRDNLIFAGRKSEVYGSKNVISNNTFQNTGLQFHHPAGNIVTNNTVNGKPLVFLDNTSNKVIDYETGQVILSDCDNVTIKNQNFSHASRCIQVLGSKNCYISNNTISSCSDAGIEIYYSDTIMIMDNTINSSWIIIGQWDSGYNNNIIVSRNTITQNDFTYANAGINIRFTYQCTLSYNNLVNAIIELSYYCYNCTFRYNNLIASGFDIYVPLFSHNTFYGNYWGRPVLFPEPIFGWVFNGEVWPNYMTWPFVFIDWNPALKPYDISGMS